MNYPTRTLRLPSLTTVRAVSELLQLHLLDILTTEDLARRLEAGYWPAHPDVTVHPSLTHSVAALWQIELRHELRDVLAALRSRQGDFADLDTDTDRDLERAAELAPISRQRLREWWDVRDEAAYQALVGVPARATTTVRGES